MIFPNSKKSNVHNQFKIRIKGTKNIPLSLQTRSSDNLNRILSLKTKQQKLNQRYETGMNQDLMQENNIRQVQIFEQLYASPFSTIYKVRMKQTSNHYILKKILLNEDYDYRQEKILKKMNSPFIVKVIDIYHRVQNKRQQVNILMELYDWNLKEFIEHQNHLQYIIFKILCYQMVRSLIYVHAKGITHRDIKPENFLMTKNAKIVLTDFGSAKHINKQESSVCYLNSRQYRAPELLLGNQKYNHLVDVWALGCTFIELLTKRQIFFGSSVIDCLINICRIIGSKDFKKLKLNSEILNILPNIKGIGLSQYLTGKACHLFVDLLTKMLKVSPGQRISAIQALAHPFFDDIRQEQCYQELKQRIDISNFFTFSKLQLKNNDHLQPKLISVWKKNDLH